MFPSGLFFYFLFVCLVGLFCFSQAGGTGEHHFCLLTRGNTLGDTTSLRDMRLECTVGNTIAVEYSG